MQQYILANPCQEDDPMRPWTLNEAPERSKEEAQPVAQVCGFPACPIALMSTEEA